MRRIPTPAGKPAYGRLTMSQEEMDALIRLAVEAKLSVTSFLRVLVVSAVTHPTPKVWEKVKSSLIENADPNRKLPGRPKKGAA